MTTPITPIYTAHAKATGGRDGIAASDDGRPEFSAIFQ